MFLKRCLHYSSLNYSSARNIRGTSETHFVAHVWQSRQEYESPKFKDNLIRGAFGEERSDDVPCLDDHRCSLAARRAKLDDLKFNLLNL